MMKSVNNCQREEESLPKMKKKLNKIINQLQAIGKSKEC
jgi:hypothetical protein